MTKRLPILITLLALAASPVLAAPRFRLVDLGFVPGGTSASATRFAPGGTVLGSCELPGAFGGHATRWTLSAQGDVLSATDLGGLPGMSGSGARGANAAGWVVGFSNTTEPQPRGILWRGGDVIDLDRGADGNANIYANDVNDAGLICGFLTKSGGGGGWDAVIWTEQTAHPGRFDRAFLPYPPQADTAFSWTEAWRANASGQVFGRVSLGAGGGDRAILWEADAVRTPVLLEPLPNSLQSMPGDFNDAGDAVGYTMYPFGLDRPTRWTRDASHTPVELPIRPGDNAGSASAVDPSGTLVTGLSGLVDTSVFPWVTLEQHVVLWKDGVLYDLAQQLDGSGAGWTLLTADAVNAGGWVAGSAMLGGVRHAVVLVPVPDATDVGPGIPAGLALSSPWPNPSRGEVRLSFALARGGAARVRILDAQGRVVATPFEGDAAAGRHEIAWNGRSTDGGMAAPGVYFASLEGADGRSVVRLARTR